MVNLMIDDCVFDNNGHFGYNASVGMGYGLRINSGLFNPLDWNITISRTKFSHNSQAGNINAYTNHNITLLLTEVFVCNNTNRFGASGFDVNLTSISTHGKVEFSIVSSVFSHNMGAALGVSISSNIKDSILMISKSNFTTNFRHDNPIVYISYGVCDTNKYISFKQCLYYRQHCCKKSWN